MTATTLPGIGAISLLGPPSRVPITASTASAGVNTEKSNSRCPTADPPATVAVVVEGDLKAAPGVRVAKRGKGTVLPQEFDVPHLPVDFHREITTVPNHLDLVRITIAADDPFHRGYLPWNTRTPSFHHALSSPWAKRSSGNRPAAFSCQAGRRDDRHHLRLRILSPVKLLQIARGQKFVEKAGVEVGGAESLHLHQSPEQRQRSGDAAHLVLGQRTAQPLYRRRSGLGAQTTSLASMGS